MIFRTSAIGVAVSLLATPGILEAQPNTAFVTLNVPLNLTNLSADVTHVRVSCAFPGTGIDGSGKQEVLSASTGQVVRTVGLKFTFHGSYATSGTVLKYECSIRGYSQSLGPNVMFSDTGQAGNLYLTPTPNTITGSVVL